MITQDSIEMLGWEAKDKITGCEGVITSVCFDLYGCIQAVLSPPVLKKGDKPPEFLGWFDINRLEINRKKKRRMTPPAFATKYHTRFEVQGAACKPQCAGSNPVPSSSCI
jgi:hypothetical protein